MRPDEWNLKLAGHLLRRATFGFTSRQLRQALADGPQKTIDRLTAPPPGYAEFEQSIAALAPREPTPQETAELQLYRILNSPYPFHEKAAFCACATDFSLSAYRRKVKTPLEFALNLAIPLGVRLAPRQLHAQLAALGQHLGRALAGPEPRWLNAYTRVGRSNLAADILSKVDRFPEPGDLIETLLQNDAPPEVLAKLDQLEGRDLAQTIVNLPEYQLL